MTHWFGIYKFRIYFNELKNWHCLIIFWKYCICIFTGELNSTDSINNCKHQMFLSRKFKNLLHVFLIKVLWIIMKFFKTICSKRKFRNILRIIWLNYVLAYFNYSAMKTLNLLELIFHISLNYAKFYLSVLLTKQIQGIWWV